MSKKNKGKKNALPSEPPPGMDARNAVYVGRRVALANVRSPIMVVTGRRQDLVKTTWFSEDLRQQTGVFAPGLLVIVPNEEKKSAPPTPEVPVPKEEDPLETLKAAEAAKDE